MNGTVELPTGELRTGNGPGPSEPETDLDRLRQQLYSQDSSDRLFAAATLLEKGSPQALKILEGIIGGGNDRAVRLSVLEAIRKRRDGRFIEALLGVLGDRDAEVRGGAAAALGALPEHGVVDRLARLAADPAAGEETQLGAVEALVLTKERPAVGVLIQLLRSPHKIVRLAALKALRDITVEDFGETYRAWADWWRVNRYKTPLQWDRDLVPKLRQQVQELKRQLEEARRDAVRWALAFERTLADPKERATFLKELLQSEYAALRAHAAQELPRIAGVEGVREALVAALSDNDARVVAAAATGLGALGDPQAAADLRRLLTRDQPEIRAAAAGALGKLAAADAVPDLVKGLDDPAEIVRLAATESLGLMQAGPAFEPLLAKLTDASPKVREVAVSAVARFKDPRAVPALIKVLLEDREAPRARFSAARSLADFAGRAVDEALVKGLADADPGVRGAAAASLGRRSDPGLVDPLIARSLDDESPTVRQEARASALTLLRRVGSLRLLDRVSQRVMDAKAYAQAAEALEVVEALADSAGPEEAPLVAPLRRRRADAFFLAENWARAAAAYGALHAAGDRSVEARLVESRERAGEFRRAAGVYLSAPLPAEEGARTARLAAAIGLAERAVAAGQPQQAIRILQSLRETVKSALAAALEDQLKRAAASANARLDALATAAEKQVKDLLGRAAGNDTAAAKSAAADLVRLGWVAVPALLAGLADADLEVRTAAVTALRAIASATFAFNPGAAEAERRAAIEKWRNWFDEQRTVPRPVS